MVLAFVCTLLADVQTANKIYIYAYMQWGVGNMYNVHAVGVCLYQAIT